jgi:hypothetical protein
MNIFEEVELFIIECIMKVNGHTFGFLRRLGAREYMMR